MPGWPAAPRTDAGLARLGGRRRAAGEPRRVPARIRRADGQSHGVADFPTGISATAASTSVSTCRWRSPQRSFRRFMFDAARLVVKHGGSCSGEHGDGRARSELLPIMYSPAAIELFGASRPCSTRTTCSTRACWSARRPLDATCGAPGQGRCLPSADSVSARRRGFHQGGAPLRRGRQMPGRQPRLRRVHVPVLPGIQGRKGRHPRPGPGAAGIDQRHA